MIATIVNKFSFNKNAKEKIFDSIKHLKNLMKNFPENHILYKVTGLFYEFIGNFKIAIIFFFIFFEFSKFEFISFNKLVHKFYWHENHKDKNLDLFWKFKKNFINLENYLLLMKIVHLNGNFFELKYLLKRSINDMFNNKKSQRYSISLLLLSLRGTIKFLMVEKDPVTLEKFLFEEKNLLKKKNNFIQIIFKNIQLISLKYRINFIPLNIILKKTKILLKDNLALMTRQFIGLSGNVDKLIKSRNIYIFSNFLYKNPKYQICFKKDMIFKRKSFFSKPRKDIYNRKYLNEKNSYNLFFRILLHRKKLVFFLIKYFKSKIGIPELLDIYAFLIDDQINNKNFLTFLVILKKNFFGKIKYTPNLEALSKFKHYQKADNKMIIMNEKFFFHIFTFVEKLFEKNKCFMIVKRSSYKIFTRKEINLFIQKKKSKKISSNFLILIINNLKRNDIFKNNTRIIQMFNNELLIERITFYWAKKYFTKKFSLIKNLIDRKDLSQKENKRAFFFEIFFLIKKNRLREAYLKLRLHCLYAPHSWFEWKLLASVIEKIGVLVSKTLRFSLRLLKKTPDSIPAIFLSANHCLCFSSYGYAQAEYFQVFRWGKNSTILNILISIQYLNGSFSRKNLFTGFSILLSVSFFIRYQVFRNFLTEYQNNRLKKNFLYRLEAIYNKGRFYLFFGIKNLAYQNFRIVIKKTENNNKLNKLSRKRKKSGRQFLLKESFFNITIMDFKQRFEFHNYNNFKF